ncbi:hypothetical protein J7K50_09585 [bacterium]|nr:hypothetical protein [bacterium]
MRPGLLSRLFSLPILFIVVFQAISSISQLEPDCPESLLLRPILPAEIRCEIGEEISFFSMLDDDAVWQVFPSELGTISNGKFRGAVEGDGFLCGKDKNSCSIAGVSVADLTPSDHDILVGLRRELAKTNLFKNHFEAADKKLRDARFQRKAMETGCVDYEIRLAPALREYERSIDELERSIADFERTRSELDDALTSYSKLVLRLKPDYAKESGDLSRVILPPGFSLGALIVYPDAIFIGEYSDWLDVLEFERANRDRLWLKARNVKSLAARLVNITGEIEERKLRLAEAFEMLMKLYAEEETFPDKAIIVQRDLDRSRELKLEALFGMKEHERMLEEMQLWYQFRRWLESRTVVGAVERNGIFNIETDAFRERLRNYIAELRESLEIIDCLTAVEWGKPTLPELPTLTPFSFADIEPTCSTSTNDVYLAEYWNKLGIFDAAAGIDRDNPDPFSAILPGAFTSTGMNEALVSKSEFDRLPEIDHDDAVWQALSLQFPIVVPEPVIVSNISPISLQSDLRAERKDAIDMILALLSKYDKESATYAESVVAARYQKAVMNSLFATESILSYLDWRLEYIQIVHGGDIARTIGFDKTEKRWMEILNIERENGIPAVTRDNLFEVYGAVTGDNGEIENPPVVEFLFGQ